MSTGEAGPGKGAIDALIRRMQGLREERIRTGEWEETVIAHYDYQDRPLEWIVKFLEVPEETIRWSLNPGYEKHKWDGDADPLVKILDGLASWNDVGVESGTGTGKTYLAACVVLWFLACFPNAIVRTVAPREEQVLKFVWKEIGRLYPKFKKLFPHAQLLSGTLRMLPAKGEEEVWAASTLVVGHGADEDSANRARGIHAEHMLIITEETPGIHHSVMTALSETRTDDHNLQLALGNPDHQQDPLHLFCTEDGVVHIRIASTDHPNIVSGKKIVPGAIGPNRLAKRTKKLGKGSRMYQRMVLGMSPADSDEALIRWDWCVAASSPARQADMFWRDGDPGLGVDAADKPTGDNSAIARFEGACCTEVQVLHADDANVLGRMVYAEIVERQIDPRYVGVDPVGVGAGTINELRRLGMRVRHLGGAKRAVPKIDEDEMWSETETDLEGNIKSAGARVPEAERYRNLRSQIYWRLREDIRQLRIVLPFDEQLFQELVALRYTTKGGVIMVEGKDEVRERIRRSTDRADALAYGNFVRRRKPVRKQAAKRVIHEHGLVDTGLERILEESTRRGDAERRQFNKRYGRLRKYR